MENRSLIDKLERERQLSGGEWVRLLSNWTGEERLYARDRARAIADQQYGNKVYVRGLIEFTNYCKNDCYYCGIRCGNKHARRYRLTLEEILGCCAQGYELGFRTFVLQGGEDPFFTAARIVEIVGAVKTAYPDCAITLSVGEWDRESYRRFYEAGADRYLLRHETATKAHYEKLHPSQMHLENRLRCLYDLKEIGFQVGCGFMVGSPFQTVENLAGDMLFIRKLSPHMVGIGPFIPHKDTVFHGEEQGSLELTLFLLSLLRIMLPDVLLPATTALGTIHPQGREMGIQAGANVVMPNLSPVGVRKKYLLYDNKICTGEEAAECRGCLAGRMEAIGQELVTGRGDHPSISRPAVDEGGRVYGNIE